jgi:hypothetical protein
LLGFHLAQLGGRGLPHQRILIAQCLLHQPKRLRVPSDGSGGRDGLPANIRILVGKPGLEQFPRRLVGLSQEASRGAKQSDQQF